MMENIAFGVLLVALIIVLALYQRAQSPHQRRSVDDERPPLHW